MLIDLALIHFNLLPYHAARYRAFQREHGEEIRLNPILLSGAPEYRSMQAASEDIAFLPKVRRPRSSTRWRSELYQALEEVNPKAVVLAAGYGNRRCITALEWAVANGVPTILCCDSQKHDAQRLPWLEWIKGSIVRSCSSYLVGGVSHVDYLVGLGAKRDRISIGLDVVDNDHFAAGQERACRTTAGFLTCARLVDKKNLHGLISAYHRYVETTRAAGDRPCWPLTIVGDGPLFAALRKQVAELELRALVDFRGFVPHRDLPEIYASAHAFVLPSEIEPWGLVVNEAMAAGLPVLVSNRCGAAFELVYEGKNGFTFPPSDLERLARLMVRVHQADLQQMSSASRAIINRWGLDRFTHAFKVSIDRALAEPRQASRGDRAMLKLLRAT